MRLVRKKIYRAFPELDRFDDETCTRFVVSARRGWVVRLLVISLTILTGSIVTFGIPGVALLLLRSMTSSMRARDYDFFHLMSVVVVASAVTGPLAGILLRDLLLRMQIRHVLRRRGTCSGCRYSLIGLHVGPGNQVTCPECKAVNEVDDAMSVLSQSGASDSRIVAAPQESQTDTVGRARRGRRWLSKVLLTSCAAFAVAWSGYEYFLHRQAAAAAAARPGVAGLLAYAESLQQAPDGPDEPNAWALLDAAERVRASVNADHQQQGGKYLWHDFTAIYELPPTSLKDREDFSRRSTTAFEALAAYGVYNLFPVFDSIATARRTLLVPASTTAIPLNSLGADRVEQTRVVAGLMNARMRLAAAGLDRDDLVAAYRTALAIARMGQTQPVSEQFTPGFINETDTQNLMRRLMLDRETTFDAATLRRLIAAAREQCWTAPPSHICQGDALCELDSIAWVFSDPSRARWGKFSPGLGATLGGASVLDLYSIPGQLGTFEGCRAELNSYVTAWTRIAAMAPADRSRQRMPDEPSHLLLSLNIAPTMRILQYRDAMLLSRSGTMTMFAVELFRREHKKAPESLDEAIQGLEAIEPTDPYSAKMLCYKRIDAKSDRLRRPYLLYSVAGNFTDDGGATPPMPYRNQTSLDAMKVAGSGGVDYIINDDR